MIDSTTTLKIGSLAYGPYGIGRAEGRVILVPLTAPGDEAAVRIVEEKKNYLLGELSRLVRPSPLRQDPPCPYFGACGGCPWQHIRYEAQLAAKEKSVEDALRRIGRLGGFELRPILSSGQEYRYRRRIRLQAEHGRLGFHRAFSHELVEIDSCLISGARAERRIADARDWIGRLKTPIRYLEIVEADEGKAVVLAAHTAGQFAPADDAQSSRFLAGHKKLAGLIISGRGWRRAWGQEKILLRSADGLKMEVDADVFTQVNPEANQALVRELLEWGEFHDRDRVLELYCGAGNYTLPVARRSREVTAVEGDPRSVENGRSNSRLNKIENIRWLLSDVPGAARRLGQKGEKFSRIILNPPRSGAKGLEKDLALLGAEKILYVSCNPATLARDLAALTARGYKLHRVQPFDLFPQTYHVEVLAEMRR